MFNANYFIVSQANPLITSFMNSKRHSLSSRGYYWYGFVDKVYELFTSEVRYRLNQLATLGLIPKFFSKWVNLVVQDYYGDLTIHHKPTIGDYLKILSHPTEDLCKYFMRKGELRSFSGTQFTLIL